MRVDYMFNKFSFLVKHSPMWYENRNFCTGNLKTRIWRQSLRAALNHSKKKPCCTTEYSSHPSLFTHLLSLRIDNKNVNPEPSNKKKKGNKLLNALKKWASLFLNVAYPNDLPFLYNDKSPFSEIKLPN